MAASSPSLSLSDIIHTFSPPPMAIPAKSSSPPPRLSTPEPLEPADIEEMRRKVLSMGWGDSSKGKEKAGTREQELADMLLRLTHPASLPQPSQLHAQAETIAHLIQQRDFLLARTMEERERWESEKESWARAAQALIIQGRREFAQAEKDEAAAAQYALVTTDASTQRIQEFERANAALQNDKKSLQEKLTDTQNRLASLESELAQLKPLLLMQPFALTHSHPIGATRGWSAALPSPGTPSSSRRQKGERPSYDEAEAEDEPESDEEPRTRQLQPRPQFRFPMLRPISHDQSTLQPPFATSPQKSKGDYYRRRETPISTIHYPSVQYSKSTRRKAGGVPGSSSRPTLSDARAEHLLLAARKIGRQRATILSGAFAHMQQQPEITSHYKQKPPSSPSKTQPQPPKTPRRNNANTPLLTRTPLGQIASSPAQPRTPLQSLLSAAQSVLSAPGAASSMPESPLAKRRKLDHAVTVIQAANTPKKEPEKEKEKDKEKDKGRLPLPGGVARVKSALDFLADQAEVYSTQPASQESAEDADSQPRDGDEVSNDVEMEDDSQPNDNTDSGGVSNPNICQTEGKEKATEPMSTSRPGTPQEQGYDPPEAEAGHTQETTMEHESQDATPSASLDAFSGPSANFGHIDSTPDLPPRLQKDPTPNGSSQLETPLMLAPPIDLTPRTSRSPAPASLLPDPDPGSDVDAQHEIQSRSPSVEEDASGTTDAPAEEAPLGTFLMFPLQPMALESNEAAPLLHPPAAETIDQEQGSSVDTTPRLVEGIKLVPDGPPRRTRSPYIKWTKEEDELLAKAVAKHGQKWDLVQKALPSRGYHQVRQRWLRKLGVFDGSKLDLSSLETNAAAEFLNISTAPPTDNDDRPLSEPHPTANPKLGLAPLNSEKTLTASSSSSGDARRSLSPLATNSLAVGTSAADGQEER